MYGEEERCIQSLMVKPEGKRPFEKPKRRLEDNNKMHLEGGWGGIDRIDLA
jgi:hypothetical protein